jgi:translation initiation factor 1
MRLFEGTPFDRPLRCEVCEQLDEDCTCPPPEVTRTPPEEQTIVIALEKRKRGKTVTVIRGLAADNDHAALLKQLKSTCGSGGSIQEGNLDIQGNHRETVRTLLKQQGYKLK